MGCLYTADHFQAFSWAFKQFCSKTIGHGQMTPTDRSGNNKLYMRRAFPQGGLPYEKGDNVLF